MSAELHAAFVWDCDQCGVENFERAVEANLDEAVIEALDELEGTPAIEMLAPNCEDLGDGEMQAACLISRISIVPTFVQCHSCGATFETEVPSF